MAHYDSTHRSERRVIEDRWRKNNPQSAKAKARRYYFKTVYGHTRFIEEEVNPKDKYYHARKHGYRSGLEVQIAKQLEEAGVPFEYEGTVIKYTKPAKESKYTPDYVLPNGIIIETKGRFVTADRQKMKLIKEQHPDLDIRFIFSNPNQRISKQSTTTYAMWAEKNGFLYAKQLIPKEWLTWTP